MDNLEQYKDKPFGACSGSYAPPPFSGMPLYNFGMGILGESPSLYSQKGYVKEEKSPSTLESIFLSILVLGVGLFFVTTSIVMGEFAILLYQRIIE